MSFSAVRKKLLKPPFTPRMLVLAKKLLHLSRLARRGERPVAFPLVRGGAILIHQDHRNPGKWRATRLDAGMEPEGHMENLSYRKALEEAIAFEADVYTEITPTLERVA